MADITDKEREIIDRGTGSPQAGKVRARETITAQRGTSQKSGNPGTLVGTETRQGTLYARYRAEKDTWVSASLAQQGYDKSYGKEVAYGAYQGLALAPDGKPLKAPDTIQPGQEYLIPVRSAVGPEAQSATDPTLATPMQRGTLWTPLVRAEPQYSPPPLVQSEHPSNQLSSPRSNRIDERSIADRTRSAKKGPSEPSAAQPSTAYPTYVSKEKWLKRALEAANITLDSWRPKRGFGANRENVEKVYAYYMRLFSQKEKELLWAGMAKLAGGVVYRGLQQSERMLISAEEGYAPPGTMYYVAAVQVILLQMQKEIFLDLAWQHQAYVEGGLAALEDASAHGENVRIEAWRDIASGNPVRVQFGNEALLRREQETILPPYYKKIRDLLDADVIPYVMSRLFTESPIPGGHKFNDVVPGGDVTQFRDRWLWITWDMLPAYQRLDSEFRRELVNRPLWKLGSFPTPAEE